MLYNNGELNIAEYYYHKYKQLPEREVFSNISLDILSKELTDNVLWIPTIIDGTLNEAIHEKNKCILHLQNTTLTMYHCDNKYSKKLKEIILNSKTDPEPQPEHKLWIFSAIGKEYGLNSVEINCPEELYISEELINFLQSDQKIITVTNVDVRHLVHGSTFNFIYLIEDFDKSIIGTPNFIISFLACENYIFVIDYEKNYPDNLIKLIKSPLNDSLNIKLIINKIKNIKNVGYETIQSRQNSTNSEN